MAQSKVQLSRIEKGYEFVAIEREQHAAKDIQPVQLIITQQRRNLFFGTSSPNLTQSRILILDNNMTVRQIRKRIFKLFRPIIEQAPDISQHVNPKGSNYNEEAIIEAEYKYFFENKNFTTDDEGFDNPLYRIQIYNNSPVTQGLFFSSVAACEFCKREHKDNCDLSVVDNKARLRDIVNRLRDRDLYLVVNWRSNPPARLDVIEKPQVAKFDFSGMNFQHSSSRVNLYDCMNFFSAEETLTGNDKWYCGKCKEHVNATKKMEVYKAPNYLII